ncbi:hypothetical protein AX16_006150 [Volvariella volvacea WC 439]|nr:hypothetical protein AX16_006150 [Volvariella volvacea WC 439]
MTPDIDVEVSSVPRPPFYGLPNMKNLKRLTIYFGNKPPATVVNLDQFWKTLKDSGTRLMIISLDYGISDSLMENLCSYEGLSHSFTTLVAVPKDRWFLADSYREDMAPDPTTWPAPSLFLRLKYLNATPPHNWETNPKNLQSLLDYASEVPALERLSIDWFNDNPRAFTGNLDCIGKMMSLKRSKLKKLIISVPSPFATACATWTIQLSPLKEDESDRRFKLKEFQLEGGYFEDSDSSSL